MTSTDVIQYTGKKYKHKHYQSNKKNTLLKYYPFGKSAGKAENVYLFDVVQLRKFATCSF